MKKEWHVRHFLRNGKEILPGDRLPRTPRSKVIFRRVLRSLKRAEKRKKNYLTFILPQGVGFQNG